MSHWTDQYVGQPYIKDELDCGGWAERILRERFGRDIVLPKERAQGLRPRSAQIATEKERFATRTDQPGDGDGVLMIARGDLFHIGIYCVIGEPRVLHAMEGAGSRQGQVQLHRIRELAQVGLRLEGFYRWN